MNILEREDRAREKERKAKVNELKKAKQPVPPELEIRIVDRERVWQTDQLQIKQQQELLARLADKQREEGRRGGGGEGPLRVRLGRRS